MKERGQSLVELAISLVVLLFLLSGVVEFGISFFQFIQLRDAVSEGGLYGSANIRGDIEQRVRMQSDAPLDLTKEDVVVEIILKKDGTQDALLDYAIACWGDDLTVSATYKHKIFMPFLPKLIGQDFIELRAITTYDLLIPPCTQEFMESR